MTTLRIKLQKFTYTIDNPSHATVSHTLGNNVSYIIGVGSSYSYSGFLQEAKAKSDILMAVHLEKRRGKMVTVEERVGRSKKTQQVRKWQPTRWIMTVTKIPVDLLKHLPNGTKFNQHKHHWELTTKG